MPPPAKGFRTVAVETQIAWPDKEQRIIFKGREFKMLPGSDRLSHMVRVSTEEGFTQLDADKLICEFLSALAWAKQRGAETTLGAWGTVPLNLGKEPREMRTGRPIACLPEPADPKAKLALALYREGLTVNLVPYQFLGFFKVINVIRETGKAQKQWIRDNLQYARNHEAIARIAEIQAQEPDIAEYLYVSGRCAVAHAFDQTKVVNPDDPVDLIRLDGDLPIIRELARIAIEREFGVQSEADFLQGQR